MNRRCWLTAATAAACGLPGPSLSALSEASDSTRRAADMTSRAARAVLNRVARAGQRLVAVGERGIVIWSDDSGRTWTQARVPVSVTLTSVVFVDDRLGWATGHAGVLLHTSDGGQTWVAQLDGTTYAKLALEQAQHAPGNGDPKVDARLQAAQRMATDGPDKPFLALRFTDAKKGLAVGAYGIAATTTDGGRSWLPCADRIDNPRGMHLYGLAGVGPSWLIAGEQGYLARSDDLGQPFTRLESAAKGSFFTAMSLQGGQILAAGLLGNACLVDSNEGKVGSLTLPGRVTVLSALEVQDAKVILVESTGRLLVSRDGGSSFAWSTTPPRGPITSMVEAADGTLVAVGVTGARRLEVTASVIVEGSK